MGPFNPVRIGSPSLTCRRTTPENARHECIDWLDHHPQNSVIYVSFGTTVALSQDQVREIATGLVNSGQRFIWVLREEDKGDIFNSSSGDDDDGYRRNTKAAELPLPKGFEQRVGGMGLVVREWVPQLVILGHL